MHIKSHCKFTDIKTIEDFNSEDIRGKFIKLFNDNAYKQANIEFDIKETFYSISQKNVIRGLHFQIPPYAQDKLVQVIKGSVTDVIVDLRMNSKYYKEFIAVNLSDKFPTAIYIPKGFAHGFKSLEDDTIMLYNLSSVYEKNADMGIRWDSIDFNWEVNEPIISERDSSFISLAEYESSFE